MPALSRRRATQAGATDEELASMRALVRADCADRPGVYRMVAADGEVLYVGKSCKVRTRLLSYFRAAFPEEKAGRIVREARRIEWTYTPSEFAALLEEMRLIKRLRPRLNVAMKRDGRNHCFIKLTTGSAAKLVVVRGAGSTDDGTYYGPFVGAQRVGEAVRELADAIGLRDCANHVRMIFADQQELWPPGPRTPGCIRHEIGKCAGPCVGATTLAAYAERAALARAFLDGRDDGPMERLRLAMHEASEAMAFERAAALRDKVRRLEALRDQFARLRFAVETLSFAYPVPGADGDDRLYLIRRGRVRAELPMPKTTADERRVRDEAAAVFSPAVREGGAVPSHEVDELLLLSSWFRGKPDELARAQRYAILT